MAISEMEKCLRISTFALAFIISFIWSYCDRHDSSLTEDGAREVQYVHSDNLDYGIPIQTDVIIEREGYAVGYSRGWRQPVWVMYRLTRYEVSTNVCCREDRFQIDPVIGEGHSTPVDYLLSGYDRGHLAPAADMLWSRKAMQESFYMSNISPQEPAFNRGIWSELEAWVRRQARCETNIVVVTGPIITTNDLEHTIGWNNVVVPSGFYKVVYDETPPEKMIGFIMSNNGSRLPLRVYSVSVDEVEELTGLDFFNLIEDIKEDNLEKMCNYEIWR